MWTLLSSAFIFKMSSSFDSAEVFRLGVEGEAGGGDELSSCVSGDGVDGGVELDFFWRFGSKHFFHFVLVVFAFVSVHFCRHQRENFVNLGLQIAEKFIFLEFFWNFRVLWGVLKKSWPKRYM